MKAFKSSIACVYLLTSLTALAADRGGHDGGGANLWASSASEVKAAIHWATEELRSDKVNWLFRASPYGPKFRRDDGEIVSVIQCLTTPAVCQSVDALLRRAEEGGKTFGNAWDYLKESPLELKEDGPCPASDKKHAAGSVSAFQVGAKLCLSVYELSRTVPGGLRAQVASVLAHEMAHLMGFDEETAFQVQKGVVENFSRITREDGSFLAYRLFGAMASIDSALADAIALFRNGQKGKGAYLIGQAVGQIAVVRDMLPDGVNDATIPVAKPELYEQVEGGLGKLGAELDNLARKMNDMSQSQLEEEVRRARDRHERLSALLEEFLGQRRNAL